MPTSYTVDTEGVVLGMEMALQREIPQTQATGCERATQWRMFPSARRRLGMEPAFSRLALSLFPASSCYTSHPSWFSPEQPTEG